MNYRIMNIKTCSELMPFLRRIECFNRFLSVLKLNFSTNSSKNYKINQIMDKNKLSKDILPPNISLRVIGNGSDGNPSSVFLSSDEKCYLFNCSEGLQRLLPEYKIKISTVDNIFITSNKWHNMSGISGLALSRFDSGVKDLTIHGIDCHKYMDFCIFFDLKLKKMNHTFYDYKLSAKPFCDNLVQITSIPINNKNKTTIVYFCKLHHKRGLFLIDKCFHMKIPRKFVPQLQSYQSIRLENGLTISPEEVHTPDEPEKAFIVLECPSIGFINQFLYNYELTKQINDKKDVIECVVHFTPEDVANDTKYQLFINQFLPQTQHLIINKQNPSYNLQTVHRFQTQLNLLDSKVFPMLSENTFIDKSVLTNNNNMIRCQTGLEYVLRPSESKGINLDNLRPFDFSEIKDNVMQDKEGNIREGLEQSLQQLKSKQQLLDKHLQNSGHIAKYPEVLFLGTAASTPKTIRNVTSILVNTSPDSSILLDCGEDTFGQLMRFYGSSQISDILKKIKALFISHAHSDHLIGIIEIIKRHYIYNNKPLVVIIPPHIIRWLNRYNTVFEDISKQYNIISTTNMKLIENSNVLKDLRVKELIAIPVIHITNSFGILIETQDNYKIVFSGDAEPSDQLIECGKDCDLLIHEATVEDALINFARDHFHSTVSEAIEVGQKMNAKFTILTHFSQRYSKLPLIPDKETNNNKIGIAYDFMKVNISDLNRLPLLLPSLKCLYAKHLFGLQKKNEYYQRRLSSLQD